MASDSNSSSSQPPTEVTDVKTSASTISDQTNSSTIDPSPSPAPAPMETPPPVISSSDGVPNFPKPTSPRQAPSQSETIGKWTIAQRIVSGFGLNVTHKNDNSTPSPSSSSPSAVLQSVGKGLVDTSMGAVKAVQIRARHMVSQNKRRYQEGEFDLDLTYITDNVIAMGFPAGDMSSGLFGYFEGFYRNHMEEVIKFFETHHKDRYKVYNLCSERLYDASLFAGKVASFPFNDHNCPPIHLIPSFCQSAYSWLKEDIQNVVVVHCKAGKARTGIMICSLLLFLKFFPTAHECIDYYNQRRCVDGKGLILPSQIRYVKYFEKILKDFNGESPPGRRCMLRGFRLHECPYWVRPSLTISDHNGILFTTRKHPKTKNLMPEDFWIRAPKKGIVVFALPGERGLTELTGDFKIQFHDRQGDFYCWLHTTLMENRVILQGSDFDDFDKRKLPVPGFKVEIVMIDYDGTIPEKYKSNEKPLLITSTDSSPSSYNNPSNSTRKENENVFSDSDGEEDNKSTEKKPGKIDALRKTTEQLTLNNANPQQPDATSVKTEIPNLNSGDIKAIAADASVFSFGDDEDDLSD